MPRKAGEAAPSAPPPAGFNEAGAFMPRKAISAAASPALLMASMKTFRGIKAPASLKRLELARF